MRKVFYILVLLFITAIVLSVLKMDFNAKLLSNANMYQWFTIGGSVCGLLLSFVFIRYDVLKEKLMHKKVSH